ncbi:SpoV family signaling peptide [Streptococcus pyogenes]|uniref:SpoV family signaling peptide n=1 Tax=Streptococcus pyogenes TaxID=1314 RepID=UPI0035A8E9ED
MKNKLFLVALATVTVLVPSLANPHHQTVHAAEQTVTQKTATETCTLDGKICYGYENINEDHTDSMVQSKSQDQGFFSWLWTQITTWFSSLTN